MGERPPRPAVPETEQTDREPEPAAVFRADDLKRLDRQGRPVDVWVMAIEAIDRFSEAPFTERTTGLVSEIDEFLQTLFSMFSDPNTRVPKHLSNQFVFRSKVIGNMTALSSYETTDAVIDDIADTPDGAWKMLALGNVRMRRHRSYGELFAKIPLLASNWYGSFPSGAATFASPVVLNNIERHFDRWDGRMAYTNRIFYGYFRTTYVNAERDQFVKGHINNLIEAEIRSRGLSTISNHSSGEDIAIISARWHSTTPTYLNRRDLILKLSDKYRLTLVHLEDSDRGCDSEGFDRVLNVRWVDGIPDLSELQENPFTVALFPDVGMTPLSIYLSNIRIAPIQMTTYSHPVSTYSRYMDYMLGGTDAEEKDGAEQYYSERLLLTPGLAIQRTPPNVIVKRTQNPNRIICCPWSGVKINASQLNALRDIAERAREPVEFYFFPGSNMKRDNDFLVSKHDIETQLAPAGVSVFINLPYKIFLEKLSECMFGLDSFPFGGNTSIIDQLYVGLPVVTWEGWQFYNRAASFMLRKIGLPELVANDRQSFVETALRMLDDPLFQQHARKKIAELDIRDLCRSLSDDDAFLRAMNHIIPNHERYAQARDRTPIIVP